MEEFKFCRACLVTGVRMYSLDTTSQSQNSIGIIYSNLTQTQICNNNQHVCFECASLLYKYHMFKSKCLRAYNILSNISVDSAVLTRLEIENIDRDVHKLESNLNLSATELCFMVPDNALKANTLAQSIIAKKDDYNEDFKEDKHKLGIKVENQEEYANDLQSCYDDDEEECEEDKLVLEIKMDEENTESHDEYVEDSQLLILNEEEYYGEDPKENQLEFYKRSIILNNNNKNLKNTTKEFLLSEKNKNIINHAEKESTSLKENKEKLTKESDNLFDLINSSLKECNDDDFVVLSVENVPKEVNNYVAGKQSAAIKRLKNIHSNDYISDNEPFSRRTMKIPIKENTNSSINHINSEYFNGYATVQALTLDDARKELLLRKESRNYIRSAFKCDFCYKGYGMQDTYENHMKRHDVENGDYECELCHLRFPKSIHLTRHKWSCHKRKYSCVLCPYICYSITQARSHVSLHKGEKYTCTICDEVFSMPNSLVMHKRKKHLDLAESVCDLCGDTFWSAVGLSFHIKRLHRKDINRKKGPKCEECKVHFASEAAWKRHLVLSSRHVVINGCKHCGERFTHVQALYYHIRTEHQRMKREKWKAAPTTSLVYSDAVEGAHQLSDDAKKLIYTDLALPYVCEVCGKAFKKNCFLMYHKNKHTGERPYKCEKCDKTFYTPTSLCIHRAIHTRKHKCDECDMVCSSTDSLNEHKKVHQVGFRPHKCVLCKKDFFHLCDLKLHIECVHDNVPWSKKKIKISPDSVSNDEFNLT